ncbi:MAG: beta-lactamase family protein [Oscillospiraceae bacterium]|nr:beta-lactamase family protein [Oscillospiraceae bacterium]
MGNIKELDKLLDEVIETGPAGAGLRVFKGTDLVYDRFVGYASESRKTPFDGKTICQLASMTKPIASAACMQLFEKGKFLLTDPVSMFIPEFEDRKVYKYSPLGDITVEPAKNVVTVGHTFDMTSGITVNWHRNNPNSEEISKLTDELEKEGRYTLQEFAKAAASVPGAFEAGEHFYYGQSLDITAAIAEVITGMTFGEFLSENIFKPLGMTDTYFHVPEEKKDRVASLYYLSPDGRKEGDFPALFYTPDYESACGGLFGTVDDYCRFALAMTLGEYKGVRLLSDNTIRLMAMNRLCPQALSEFQNPYLSGYGYGLAVRTRMNPEAGSNTSIGEFGWTGGFGSWVLMDPEKQITIVYAHQAVPNREGYVHPRIRNIVYSALA